MTELRTGQLAAGFFTAQQTQTSRDTRQSDVSGGFMQSLKQTGAAAVDMGQAADKTVTRTGTPANRPADTAAKSENTADSAAKTEPAAGTSDISETSSAAGTVKVDEKAVKELNDLREAAGRNETPAADETKDVSGSAGEESGKQLSEETADALDEVTRTETENTGKSHFEMAKEALENAMLRAFKELNDPDKKQEEFEEKLLLFLMKLVDSINGKTEKKSPLTSEEDEEEEKLGGALMAIIDNMLENAEKNAEMNPEQTAASDAAFIGNYFLNPGNTGEGSEENEEIGVDVRRNIELKAPELYPEIDNLVGRGGRIGTNPVVTPVYAQSAGEAKGEITASDADLTAAGAADSVNIAADTANVNPVHIGEAVQTAVPAAVQKTGEGFAAENRVQVEEAYTLPVTEQVVNTERNDSGSGFSQTAENGGYYKAVGETEAETAPETNYGTAVDGSRAKTTETKAQTAAEASAEAKRSVAPEKAAQTAEKTENTPVKTVLRNPENIVSDVRTEAEEPSDRVYEQLAESVYNDVKQTLKEVYAEKGGEVLPPVMADTQRTDRGEPESEFDELARLFGLKKEEELPPVIMQEEENEETDFSGAGADSGKDSGTDAKESIFGADISISSVKAADAPIPRVLPTGGTVSRVVTQIVNQILGNLPEKGQETTLTVTLNPETLGKISLKLVENAGKISVTITAENKETAAILASRAESVQESMRDQGTQLEKYQVVYGAQQDSKADQQNYEGSSKNPYVRDTEEENGDGEFEEILRQTV